MLHSAVLIIPVGKKAAADALGAAMGWGEVSYTIPLSSDGETVTHYAARADVSAQFIRWVRGHDPLPEGLPKGAAKVIGALVSDFSPDPDDDGEEPLPVLWGRQHFDAVLAERGLFVMRSAG